MHITNTLIYAAVLLGTAQAVPASINITDDSPHLLARQSPVTSWQSQLDLDPVNPNYPSGYPRRYFYEHFRNYNPGTQPPRTRWAYAQGTSYPGGPANWGTGEVQSYTGKLENIYITTDRTLQIVPIRRTVNGVVNWTSARIETTPQFDFTCPAGGKIRVQASIKLGTNPTASQLGIWPAFWSMGSAFRSDYYSWPASGEIDIMESTNGAARSWQVIHCGTAPGGPCNEFTGLVSSAPAMSRGAWHLVSLDIDRTNAGGSWTGEKLVWRVDGAIVFTITGSTVNDQAAWTALTRTAKFLLLNVAVGGGFPDWTVNPNPGAGSTPTAATLGGVGSGMEVRYVAVFGSI